MDDELMAILDAAGAPAGSIVERVRWLATPDLHWPWNDPERPEDIDEYVWECDIPTGDIVRFQSAKRMPDTYVVSTGIEDFPTRPATADEIAEFKARAMKKLAACEEKR